MEWLLYLFVLLYPFVMIICMKANNHHKDIVSPAEIEKKLKFIQEENNMLRDEVDFLSELVKLK
ncbi:hypothetical protein [Neobacillus sp. SuZ13]|uniref:hypothetical protein n=1 Tax=Neobacillus sp. SuZ13 TaxID=3047875 RepID=UPI0024BF9226|nr:hypothetical protein [Neobacillus sp. SuZ13]WHY68459.1 hypothetical protein QNH17_07465 [Neobacillus sp. SuZ13]